MVFSVTSYSRLHNALTIYKECSIFTKKNLLCSVMYEQHVHLLLVKVELLNK